MVLRMQMQDLKDMGQVAGCFAGSDSLRACHSTRPAKHTPTRNTAYLSYVQDDPSFCLSISTRNRY